MRYPVITEKTRLLPFYVTGISADEYHGEKNVRNTGYMWYQISLCTEGEGFFADSSGIHPLSAGTGFYFSPYAPHSYYASKMPWKLRWITFEGEGLDDIMSHASIGRTETFKTKDIPKFCELFDKIHSIILNSDSDSEFMCSVYLYQIISMFTKCVHEEKQKGNENKKPMPLSGVVEYMMGNYEKDITLVTLAKIADVTPNYLCRRFKEIYGETVFSYLKEIRLNAAVNLLINAPYMPISEIAERIGINDTSYFCKEFKVKTHFSPMQFRKMHKNDAAE